MYPVVYLAHADDEAVKDGASARDCPDLLEAHGHQGQRVRLLVFLVLNINQRSKNAISGHKGRREGKEREGSRKKKEKRTVDQAPRQTNSSSARGLLTKLHVKQTVERPSKTTNNNIFGHGRNNTSHTLKYYTRNRTTTA